MIPLKQLGNRLARGGSPALLGISGLGLAALAALSCAGSHARGGGAAAAPVPASASAVPAAGSPAPTLGTPAVYEPRRHQTCQSNLGLLESLTRETAREAVDSLPLPANKPVTVVSTSWNEANWFVGNLVAEALAAKGHQVRFIDLSSKPAGTSGNAPSSPNGGQQENGQQNAPAQEPTRQVKHKGAMKQNNTAGASQDTSKVGAAQGDTTGAHADSLRNADPLWGGEEQDTTSQKSAPAAPEEGAPTEAAAQPTSQVTLPAGDVLDVRVLEFGVGYSDVGRSGLFGPLRFTRVGGVYLQVSHLLGPDGDLEKVVTAERHAVDHLNGGQRALVEGASYPFTAPEMKPPSLGRYVEPTVVVAIVASLVYLFQQNQN